MLTIGSFGQTNYGINYLVVSGTTFYRVVDLADYIAEIATSLHLPYHQKDLRYFAVNWRRNADRGSQCVIVGSEQPAINGQKVPYGWYAPRRVCLKILKQSALLMRVEESVLGEPFAYGELTRRTELVEKKKKRTAAVYSFRGQQHTVVEIAKLLSASESFVRKKLKQGLCADEIEKRLINAEDVTASSPAKTAAESKPFEILPSVTSNLTIGSNIVASFERFRSSFERRAQSIKALAKAKKKVAEISALIADAQNALVDARTDYLEADGEYEMSRATYELSIRGIADGEVAGRAA